MYRIKVNNQRNIYHADTNQKKAGVIILISDTAYFGPRKVIRNMRGENLQKLTQKEIDNLNGLMSIQEIESIIN